MDVSIIVPAYNEEKYIEKTLKAIENQKTHLRYEIIVSDGLSKDKTLKIARKYTDLIVTSKKRGIWAGRNAGGLKAKGRLLVFIDADTVVPQNYLDIAYAVMQDRKISGLSCAFRFDRASRILRIIETLSNKYLLLKGKLGIGELLGFNCVMRKNDFLRVGGFPNKPLEDGAMARKLHKLGRVIYLPEPQVITSSRRMLKNGTIKSIEYYANLEVMTYLPKLPIAKLARYKNYLPIR
ncbi:glycosyltransferase [Candidatus Micrarchaeota archaeon]|nr:glycosyltransferase [Candidatus Micrarchaeota archaeon]